MSDERLDTAAGKRTNRRYRRIMEEHLGRKLTRDEVVHHINGDLSDDRIENLQVMTNAEHSRLHSTGRPMSEKQRATLEANRAKGPRFQPGNQHAAHPHTEEAKAKISAGLRRAYQEGRRGRPQA